MQKIGRNMNCEGRADIILKRDEVNAYHKYCIQILAEIHQLEKYFPLGSSPVRNKE